MSRLLRIKWSLCRNTWSDLVLIFFSMKIDGLVAIVAIMAWECSFYRQHYQNSAKNNSLSKHKNDLDTKTLMDVMLSIILKFCRSVSTTMVPFLRHFQSEETIDVFSIKILVESC